MFEKARPGALFLFLDNADDRFSTPLAEVCRVHGLVELAKWRGRMTMNYEEQKTDLGDYLERIGRSPKLQGNVDWSVWTKSS